mmetsp:Transcript_42417/g.99602  ORF Transcript_42417/g.99602 Transcript_42417/m.99602 type:complete len:294 (-) Transcript_42417:259-1140(-)|eukprot:CAMPEP_0113310656 /NCGR_PEP_ID=MMETSP0010_2-20120614/8216_1 /TAXON_ID=216773 ORGANISM="Corethron hystrix, Strain 308" /NCGR_SAMPLE_ID=MMETSP0010_2 /ASSEMBLY_ACC=CAM_ASM_000155 /LENGTH=293 /DNA_ID=CAMNT_0000166159 /DNA_START=39 /DNA_END=920 /DNA_ORIENTATION=+ /assembly_acc=CAM_ASM_000155
MASRNSCTKFTWAEAKKKTGSDASRAAKAVARKVPHSKILAEKIIAKTAAAGDPAPSAAQVRRSQRGEEKAAAAIAAAKAEREREREGRRVRPTDLARERLRELARRERAAAAAPTEEEEEDGDPAALRECAEMQADEILALEALYADTGAFLAEREEEEEDGEEEFGTSARPPRAFAILLELDLEDAADAASPRDLVAALLLRVTLPPRYPFAGAGPRCEVVDDMVTDRGAVCRPDKVLESLAVLDRDGIRRALEREAEAILPDPCVYELVAWLTEHIDEFVQLRARCELAS